MKAAIMQPTYLPWVGYFDLMDQCDIFVYLDSVQFDKRSWQQRNRIKNPQGDMYLTVPVLSKNRYHQRIDETEIDLKSKFIDEHTKAIQWNYGKAPFFKDYFHEFVDILNRRHHKLVDLNIELIEWFKIALDLKTRTLRSSNLNVSGQKTQLLINICQDVKCLYYISPAGSKVYIDENNLFPAAGIALQYQDYEPSEYSQLFGTFVPYLSILDLLLNEGPASLAIIRAGRKENIAL